MCGSDCWRPTWLWIPSSLTTVSKVVIVSGCAQQDSSPLPFWSRLGWLAASKFDKTFQSLRMVFCSLLQGSLRSRHQTLSSNHRHELRRLSDSWSADSVLCHSLYYCSRFLWSRPEQPAFWVAVYASRARFTPTLSSRRFTIASLLMTLNLLHLQPSPCRPRCHLRRIPLDYSRYSSLCPWS